MTVKLLLPPEHKDAYLDHIKDSIDPVWQIAHSANTGLVHAEIDGVPRTFITSILAVGPGGPEDYLRQFTFAEVLTQEQSRALASAFAACVEPVNPVPETEIDFQM